MALFAHHRRILGCVLILCVVILGFTGWVIERTRDYALQQASLSTDSLAEALSHHATRAIESVGLVVSLVVNRLEQDMPGTGDPAATHAFLAAQRAEAPHIRNVMVLDPGGAAIHDSGALPPRSLAIPDHSFFRRHRETPGRQLSISPPFRSPIDGVWIVIVSRRLDTPDGKFAGVVAASLDLAHFRSLYRSLRPGERGSIALFSDDGKLIVREPPAEGATLPVSTGGGESELISTRKLDGLPVLVAVSADREEALQVWRRDLVLIGGAGLSLLGIIVFMGVLVAREVRQRTSAEFLSRNALRRLERQHAVVATMLKTLPDGVQLLDRDLQLVGWNDRLFEIFELDRAAILGAANPARALRYALAERGEYGPGAADQLVAEREQSTSGGLPVYFRKQQRTGRWIECRGTPVEGEGYLGVFRDISEEVAREAELRNANLRLEQQAAELVGAAERLDTMRRSAEEAYWEADRANRAKSAFLANMSHELRTPLNAINGFSEIIADLAFGPAALERYREYARDIHVSGLHLLGLINSILDLAKIEAGRMELSETVVDLGSCLAAAFRMIEPAAAGKRLRVSSSTPSGPLRIRADEQKLMQSFLNVLSNAVKFTPEDGAVSATVQWVGPDIAVTFRDSGIGIAGPDMARVFTPFAQASSPLTRSTTGTGLGLALTKSLVELHGGRIELESEPGAGTVVTIRLPAARLVPEDLRAAS